MACPFFSPVQRANDLPFLHPARLPLGAGWRGVCSAQHDRPAPTDVELENCNLGYATTCPRLPRVRQADAVRFAVARESQESVSLQFVFEFAHQPAGHGVLEYDRRLNVWPVAHPDSRTQRLAEAFLSAYLERTTSSTT